MLFPRLRVTPSRRSASDSCALPADQRVSDSRIGRTGVGRWRTCVREEDRCAVGVRVTGLRRTDRRANRSDSEGSGLLPREPAGRVVLAGLDLCADGLDPDHDLLPQVGGNLLVAAVPVHEPFDDLFQAELAQARPALVEVDLDLGVGDLVHLAVQVAVDPVENLATRHLVWVSAAHDASAPGALADDDCCGAEAAMPKSAA